MSKNATGALTKIVGVTQSEFGEVPGAPAAEVLHVTSFDLSDNEPEDQDATLGSGYRGQPEGAPGQLSVTGTAGVNIGTSIAWWLKHLVGNPTTTGSGAPYTHLFAVGDGANALPAAGLYERDYSSRITGAGRYVRNQDVRIASAAFALSATSTFQTASFTMVGASRRTLESSPIDATPEDFGHGAFPLSGVSMSLDDGSTEFCVESLNINFSNDLDDTLRCLNNGGQLHDLPEGSVIVAGDGVGHFDTAAVMAKAAARGNLKLVIVMKRGTGAGTAGNEQLTITIPLSKISAPTPAVNGPRGLKQNFSFVAHRPAGAEIGVTFELKSPRATV